MSPTTPDSDGDSADDLTFTRRTALALLGAGGAAAAASGTAAATHGSGDAGAGGGNQPWYDWEADVDAQGHDLDNLHSIDVDHVYASARDANVVVWKDEEGVFHADGRDGHVTSGEEMLDVINAALDSLTDGRTSKEKVVVASPGTLGPYPDDELFELSIPSYTILDVPVTLRVEEEGDSLFFVRARDAEHIDVPNFNLVGNPRYGLWFQSVSNVHLGDINIAFENTDVGGPNLGVRIDQYGNAGRSTDVQIDSGYVANSGHHAFETNGVTRFQAGTLIADDPANGGLNMDHTIDATVNSVVGFDPGHPSTYATVRLANFCHNVSVGQVVSRGGAKGLMLITAQNASFGEVNIEGADDSGVFVSLSSDVSIDGGVIKNCLGEAIRIHGYPQDTFQWNIPTEGITVSNMRIYDDQPEGERTQTYAIRESGETAFNNQFVNNDLRRGGTEEILSVASASSVVAGNLGDGVASGTTTLTSGGEAARVTGITGKPNVTLDLRAKPLDAPDARCSWEEYFEWDPAAGAWELVVEWRTDPGEDVTIDYIVDRPQANLDREGYEGDWDEYADEGPADPHR